MDLVPWQQHPWPGRELSGAGDLLAEVDRVFQRLWSLAPQMGGLSLPAQWEDAGEELVVRVQLPGVDPRQLEIRLGETALSIGARATHEVRRDVEGGVRTAASYARWASTVALPVPVDPTRSRATVQDGILEVRAPKRGPLRIDLE